MAEPLMRERQFPDLSLVEDCQNTPRAAVDDLLVESAQEGGSDAEVAPIGMNGQREEVGIRSTHQGDRGTDELARWRDRDDRWSVVVKRFNDVAPIVGSARRRARDVDEPNDLLGWNGGITTIERYNSPSGGHQ